ncbi:unnamed protein product [Angiostrongylus costaricensis]|uniref:Peptidase M28 n=1 Tax=Angiostrongylus costaricensis TaxID=334426 RepID=A0A0R3Q1M4_ANGCS|nr:unnamed protein product [Angiostrongylus costaricensis]
MTQTAVIIAVLCLTTSVLNAQSLYGYEALLGKTALDLDDLRSLIAAEKRNFRFHAARGKKYDPQLLKRYGYTPSRGKKTLQVDVINSSPI